MRNNKLKGLVVIVFVLSFVGIIGMYGLKVANALVVTEVRGLKVDTLIQQQLINGGNGGMNTKIRYVIVTDKETFISERSVINGKFDNSNIFFRLKNGNIYNFKVEGRGKSYFYDYRNILDTIK